jgi:hypothetical protein
MTQPAADALNEFPNLIELIGRQSLLQGSKLWMGPSIGSDELPDLSTIGSDELSDGAGVEAASENMQQNELHPLYTVGTEAIGQDEILPAISICNDGNLLQDETVSDTRLKTDIVRVGKTVYGLPLYNFKYIGRTEIYEGVMAQDVLKVMPSAVVRGADGYYRVKYKDLGVQMRRVA